MKFVRISYFLPLLLFSCGPRPDEEVPLDSDTTANVDTLEIVDTLTNQYPEVHPDTIIFNNLADFFSFQTCDRIRDVNERFRTYSTNQQFDMILFDANEMLNEMLVDIYETKTKFKNEMKQEYGQPETMALIQAVDKYSDSLLPIAIDCGAECVEVAFFLDFDRIRPSLRLSPSEADDELVEIMRRVYGVRAHLPYPNRIGWKEWWSDESFAYTFGNDYIFDTFMMMTKLQEKFPHQFTRRLGVMKNLLINEMDVPEDAILMESREHVIMEFQAIYDYAILSDKQSRKIEKIIERIQSSKTIRFEGSM